MSTHHIKRSRGLKPGVQDRLGGLEWGGMDKRRVEGITDEKRRMGRRLPVLFLGCACTGKRREQHPLDILQPDSAAFVHATHLPILSCTLKPAARGGGLASSFRLRMIKSMTSDRPIDTQQPYVTEMASTWRVILTPWMYIFRPGRAAETMVNARTSSFVISYLCGCAVLTCVILIAKFFDQIISRLAYGHQLLYLSDLMNAVRDTRNSWVTTSAFSRSVLNSVMICVIAVALNLLLAWLKWPSLLSKDRQTSSFGYAFRCMASSLGFVALLVLIINSIVACYVYIRLSLNPRTPYWLFVYMLDITMLPSLVSLCLLLIWVSRAGYHLVSTADTTELPQLCEGCGYDLTHQSSEGKCTECGLALDESLLPEKRRTGCVWELPCRASASAFFSTTNASLRNLESFYGALKIRTSVERTKKFVTLHYLLLSIASASWIYFAQMFLSTNPNFSSMIYMSFYMLILTPLLGWIGLHFVAAILTTWWMANRMLPDPSVVRKVLAYETTVLWPFFIFTAVLMTSYFAYDDWVSEFVGRKFFCGMPMELFVMFFGYVLLGILSFRRFHRALMAVRWANF